MDPSTVDQAADRLRQTTDHEPETGLVLGSGIGPLADQIQDADTFPYSDLPGFHASGVEGHAGQLVIGELAGRTVVAMQGRTHFYETGDMDPVVLPVRVMRRLGAEELLLTNAAGGIAEELAPGDLMLLSDHINKMGTNPLIGEHDDSFGERFPDLSQPYSKQLRQLARDRASEELKEGVYAAMSGPSYETPAEIRMLRTLGADAVGMSTVPEAIVANQEGMDVLGISSITNHAAGIADQPLDHDEVLEVTDQVQDRLQRLVKNIVAEL